MAKVEFKMMVIFGLWCAALTVAFVGMACYVVTNGGWRKDCMPPDNERLEAKLNKTRPQFTLHNPKSSQLPPKESPNRDPQEAPGNHKLSKLPIAHLIAVGKLDGSNVKWESFNRESTLQSVNYSQGSLIISEQGHYYVYSQVSFVGTNCENGSEVLQSKVMFQENLHHASILELMEAAQSVCEGPNNKTWYQSLRQGGVFRLEKYSRLFVKIIPFQRAELEHHKTYFGAFKIQ